MRIGYFDCFSGASGDMILGACIDAGVALDALRAELGRLHLPGYRLDAEKVSKQGFAATQANVVVEPSVDPPHRHLKQIQTMIADSDLNDSVKQRAVAVFTRLAEAEAAAHGTTIEKVHFHEVGAVDALVDIVGACISVELLGFDEIRCSPIPTGSGTVTCQHGTLPVPAPATANLLKGVPLAACDEPGELTTPTGAAILTTLSAGYGPLPGMVVEMIGYGAGRHDGQTRPNVLRLLAGERAAETECDAVAVLEANLDDTTPEAIAYATEKLFAAGALDVFCTPVSMKKGRPATLITVLATPSQQREMKAILFAETTTFGIRCALATRTKLSRATIEVETAYGRIRLKVGRREGQVVTVSPEFEDCRTAAQRAAVPLREVMAAALRATPADL
ncbi:MAG: nickel pincer cofactor biosynthesis protein LarC [Phycisphaerae bacterium]|nr:nickel pincer cofactor biosynthesis protein LarC [Phycisphaerae bacterium]